MLIDIFSLVAIGFAVYKGFSRGFVIALFSFIAYFIGLAAAMKLSATVAASLSKDKDPSPWLPALSFLLVFVAVIIIVILAAKGIRSLIRIGQLGLFDRIGGILLFILIDLFILSIIVFYGDKLHFFGENTKQASITYQYIAPIAPAMISFLGEIIPVFKGLFADLQNYFGHISQQLNKPA